MRRQAFESARASTAATSSELRASIFACRSAICSSVGALWRRVAVAISDRLGVLDGLSWPVAVRRHDWAERSAVRDVRVLRVHTWNQKVLRRLVYRLFTTLRTEDCVQRTLVHRDHFLSSGLSGRRPWGPP